jgi:hypothetical protein
MQPVTIIKINSLMVFTQTLKLNNEDGSLLWRCIVCSGRYWQTYQRSLLPPSSAKFVVVAVRAWYLSSKALCGGFSTRRSQIRTTSNYERQATPSTLLATLMLKTVSSSVTPNMVVEWLTLLLRIREIPGSNLHPETGYRDTFSCFRQSPYANAGIVT